jgi:UDP-N-acetylmuramoyl-tripeptide--D-alanyl-D-alanine ligase
MEPQPDLTAAFVARALGDVTSGPFSHRFTSVTTDSRRITPGCLFVGIQGEKFDGSDFAASALEQGAGGVICRHDRAADARRAAGGRGAVFPVADTQAAYRRLAGAWRAEFAIPVVAVAGSVGKTTTKELLAAVLAGRWPGLLKTQGSQNGFVGIPMTLLELRPAHGAAVIEIGIDDVGAMADHLALVRPTVSVVTAIGPEHLEKLGDLETVAREESLALTRVAADGGSVAVNLDEPRLAALAPRLRGAARAIGFTLREAAAAGRDTLRGRVAPDGRSVALEGTGARASWTLPLPLPGSHNASNLLAAVAVARALGLGEDEITAGLSRFAGGAGGRSELRELPGPIAVVCDYYNANPTSVEAGLALLDEVARRHAGARRWACLADMLELGAEEERYHRELAGPLARLGIEHVLLHGPRMRGLVDELARRKFPGSFRHFDTHDELARALIEGARPGDAVLIKGSRGMRMEEVWKPFQAARAGRS